MTYRVVFKINIILILLSHEVSFSYNVFVAIIRLYYWLLFVRTRSKNRSLICDFSSDSDMMLQWTDCPRYIARCIGRRAGLDAVIATPSKVNIA